MTSLAVRVPVVHCEALACTAVEGTVARKGSRSSVWWQERIAALGAEKVLRVVRALAKPV